MSHLTFSNLSNLSLSFKHPISELSELLNVIGWHDFNTGIYAANLVSQAKAHRLRAALQSYILQPNSHHGWNLITLLREAEKDLKTEYEFFKKQYAFYRRQAEQERKRKRICC